MQTVRTLFFNMTPHRRRTARFASIAMLTLAALPAYAQQAGGDPWDNAVNVLKTAFTGPIATGLSLVAIVIGGLMFAYGEGQSKRMLAGIVFGDRHGDRRGELHGLVISVTRTEAFVETLNLKRQISTKNHVRETLMTTSSDAMRRAAQWNGARSNKVFKAMNRPLTILGAERRLFFVALISGGAVFSLMHSLLGGILLFAAGVVIARNGPPSTTWRYCAC